MAAKHMSNDDAWHHAVSLVKSDRDSEAIPILEGLVSEGSADAAFLLFQIYRIGFPKSWTDKVLGLQVSDPQKAKATLEMAVSLGHPEAQAIFARAYFEGTKGSLVFHDFEETQEKQNFSEAYFWACRVVDNRRFCSQTPYVFSVLAELYVNGLGCESDLRHAVFLRAIAEEYRNLLHPNNKQNFVPLRPRSYDLPDDILEIAHIAAIRYVNSDRPPISTPAAGNIFTDYALRSAEDNI